MLDLIFILGVIAVVLTVTALAPGLVECSLLSFPLIFLGLGFLMGSKGFDALDVGSHFPFLEVVAIVTSALAPALILGPGTALIVVVAVWAFTDPVVLWEIVGDQRIIRLVRQELKI